MTRAIVTGVLAAASLLSGTTFAAELGAPNAGAANVVFESWDGGKRMLILRSGLIEPYSFFGCTVAVDIGIPATITKGRAVYVTYAGPGPAVPGAPANTANTCSQISFN